jgi:catechol 2,3-dioxygenase-like lactoylglutathione lyase family enzyme
MRVSHVILRVTDLERLVGFYRDAVGLDVVSMSEEFAFLDAGSIRLALNRAEDPRAAESLTDIVLEVDDIETAQPHPLGPWRCLPHCPS